MKREQLIVETRRLIAEGERLQAEPTRTALRTWLQVSDALLSDAWGSMDRYHLAWLMVGRSKDVVRGRPLTEDEEIAEVREVASQKTAALRMSLDAVERQGMPFRGEVGGVAPGQGMGRLPPEAQDLARLVEEARNEAERHRDADAPHAPRPDRLRR